LNIKLQLSDELAQLDPDCQTYFHVECARRAGYNLAYGCEWEIYCEKHRNFFRKQTVHMLNRAKEKEIIDFAFNLEDCIRQNKLLERK